MGISIFKNLALSFSALVITFTLTACGEGDGAKAKDVESRPDQTQPRGKEADKALPDDISGKCDDSAKLAAADLDGLKDSAWEGALYRDSIKKPNLFTASIDRALNLKMSETLVGIKDIAIAQNGTLLTNKPETIELKSSDGNTTESFDISICKKAGWLKLKSKRDPEKYYFLMRTK